MGHFENGEWMADDWSTVAREKGAFVRPKTAFHSWIRADGSSEFEPQPGRYHLYVSYACPWADRTGTIVNNESADIIRMFDAEFGRGGTDFYPADLRAEIDSINDRVYETINNGVYKCGFAQTQEAYEEAFDALFATLDELEARLGSTRYLTGSRLTEADWRLFPTLVRFDAVYYTHFKCNFRRIEDYANLSNYLRELYQVPGVAATVNVDHIKQHYYGSHESINPRRIVAKGPALDFMRPHDRDRWAGEALAVAG